MTRITKAELQRQLNVKTAEADSHENISNARQKALFEIERKIREMVFEVDGRERKADLEDSQVDLLDYFLTKYKTRVNEAEYWRDWSKALRRSKPVMGADNVSLRQDIEFEMHALRNENRSLSGHNMFGVTIRNYPANPNTLYMRVSNKDLAQIIVGQVAGLMVSFPEWGMNTFIEDGDVVLLLTFHQGEGFMSNINQPTDMLKALHAMIFEPLIYEVNGNPKPSVDAQPAKA